MANRLAFCQQNRPRPRTKQITASAVAFRAHTLHDAARRSVGSSAAGTATHLGHDVELAPSHAALGQGRAHHGLIAIELRTIYVSVPCRDGVLDDLLWVLVRCVAGLHRSGTSDPAARENGARRGDVHRRCLRRTHLTCPAVLELAGTKPILYVPKPTKGCADPSASVTARPSLARLPNDITCRFSDPLDQAMPDTSTSKSWRKRHPQPCLKGVSSPPGRERYQKPVQLGTASS